MIVSDEQHLMDLFVATMETYVKERVDDFDDKDALYIAIVAKQHTESVLSMLHDWFGLEEYLEEYL